MNPIFFATPAELRAWLEENHATAQELWVGFYKKNSGLSSITWAEAVDEALCFGWIDGIRKSVDEKSYTNRLTPRKPKSNWSAVNIKRVRELTERGRMHPAGIAAFEKRTEERSNQYSYEREHPQLPESYEHQFRANETAWNFFHSQPPSYRKPALWWVISAKQEITRQRRLDTLIADSEAGLRLKQFRRDEKK